MSQSSQSISQTRALRVAAGCLVASAILVILGGSQARAGNIPIPKFGDLTLFATGNVGVLAKDGTLGAVEGGVTEFRIQNNESLVGAHWIWDIGRSHKIIGHVEFGGQFTELEDTFDDFDVEQAWIGVSNVLGTITYGRQPLAFRQFYGLMIDRDPEFYATGYTSLFAGGVEFSSHLLKFSSSIERFEYSIDYQPPGGSANSPVASRFGIGGRYRRLIGRVNFGVAYDRTKMKTGGHENRFGAAVEYESEQWSVAAGAHRVDDTTPNATISYNVLTILKLTQNDTVHLTLAYIDDDDVYNKFFGMGFYLEHMIGSRWRVYAEGAATFAEGIWHNNTSINKKFLVGIRFDFGNVWY